MKNELTNSAVVTATVSGHRVLTDDEQRELVALAQEVEADYRLERNPDTDEVEWVAHDEQPTPRAKDAMVELVTAFMPLLTRVARETAMEYEDALSSAVEHFIRAVHDHDAGGELPLSRKVGTIVERAVAAEVAVARATTSIPARIVSRYRSLVAQHDGDVAAAYREVGLGGLHFTPQSFLSVHYALSASESLDEPYRSTGSARGERVVDDGPDQIGELIEVEYVNWLFKSVDRRERRVLRTRYGFDDTETVSLAEAAGVRACEELSDREVAHVLHMSRPTVQRVRESGLEKMRRAVTESMELA